MNVENLAKSPRAKSIAGAVVIALAVFALAQWWNPFGPSTYEDCILQGTRGVTNDEALNMIRQACEVKFKSNSDSSSPLSDILNISRNSLLSRCKIPANAEANSTYSIFGRQKLADAANNLHGLKIGGFLDRNVSFQNRNNFSISAVGIGFTKQNNCPASIDEYDASFICSGQPVGGNTYGTLQCPESMSEFSSGTCLTSIQPTAIREAKSAVEIATIFDKLGLCD